MAIIKISTKNKCWREYGEKETFLHSWLECKLIQPLCRTVWRFHGGGDLVANSCPTLVTPWTVARQAPLSMGSSRQDNWSEFPFPSPGDRPDSGIEPGSPALQENSLPIELQGKP